MIKEKIKQTQTNSLDVITYGDTKFNILLSRGPQSILRLEYCVGERKITVDIPQIKESIIKFISDLECEDNQEIIGRNVVDTLSRKRIFFILA